MPTNILTPRAGSNLLSLLGDTVRENAARRKDKKLDVHLATQRIADLCAHTSWHAANSRSLLFSAAAADAEQAAEDATALRALLPEAVVAALQAHVTTPLSPTYLRICPFQGNWIPPRVACISSSTFMRCVASRRVLLCGGGLASSAEKPHALH